MDDTKSQRQAVLDYRSANLKSPLAPISKIQAHFGTDREPKGNVLVAKTTVLPPGDAEASLRALVGHLFIHEGEGIENFEDPFPAAELKAEWPGVRSSLATTNPPLQPLASANETEKYRQIRASARSDLAIFYLVGGAWFRGGIAFARPLLKDICQQSGGSIFTIQPRLAPQYTMPSILLDALLGYFGLLSPGPKALHEPMYPGQIVLAGESAGATLQLSIIQILRCMRKQSRTILFNGRHVPLDMPAGCAIVSPPADMTLSLPSFTTNSGNDYLTGVKPWLKKGFPKDELWPTSPPRGDLFANNSALCHPFISVASCIDWTGAPPVWIACGEETHADGIKLLARNLVLSKVPTQFVQYEFMPHIFPMVLYKLPQSRDCMVRWGLVCRDMVSRDTSNTTGAWFIRLGTLEVEERDILELSELSNDAARQIMRSKRDYLAPFVWVGPRAGYAKI